LGAEGARKMICIKNFVKWYDTKRLLRVFLATIIQNSLRPHVYRQ
jgi:hypothetical protein